MGRKVKVMVDVEKLARAGGLARGQQLSTEELSEAGRSAVKARWDAYYAAHPEKLKAKLEREAKKGTVPRGRPPKKKTVKRARKAA